MSELNIEISASSFVNVDKESIIQDPMKNIEANAVNNIGIKEAPADPEEEAPSLTAKEVTETVDEMNSFLQNMNRNLSFSVDEQLGQSVILVKDAESDEVIRQIPSEELVVLRKKMDDVVGILFDTKV